MELQIEMIDDTDPDEPIRRTNQYGYEEYGFWGDGVWFPICSSCQCHMMPNRGGGMNCDDCNWQDEQDMMHDHYDYTPRATEVYLHELHSDDAVSQEILERSILKV